MAKRQSAKPNTDPAPKSDAAPTAAASAPESATVADATVTALTDDAEGAVRNLIHRCERASSAGHGLDSDRELLKEAAVALRFYAGILDVDVAPVPGAYAPVEAAPPIGHSLPDRK